MHIPCRRHDVSQPSCSCLNPCCHLIFDSIDQVLSQRCGCCGVFKSFTAWGTSRRAILCSCLGCFISRRTTSWRVSPHLTMACRSCIAKIKSHGLMPHLPREGKLIEEMVYCLQHLVAENASTPIQISKSIASILRVVAPSFFRLVI
jgi:hypothetical protein